MAGGMLATSAPDLDLLIPSVLDRLGIDHDLNTGVHHRWVTHTPLFWGLTVVGVHLLQDSLANTVALLWPLRRREYGLGLDRLSGVDDHLEYIRRYPSSPAGKLEAGLLLAAGVSCAWRLAQRGNDARRSS